MNDVSHETCARCEMPNSCARDKRCYCPRTLDSATKECKEAAAVLNAASTRMNNAIQALRLAMELEMK